MAVTKADATGRVTKSQRQRANGESVTCDIVGTCCLCYACDGCYSQRARPGRTVLQTSYLGLTKDRKALKACQLQTGTAVTI